MLDIWEYIATDNEDAADRLIDRFTEMYEKLAGRPQMGIKQEQMGIKQEQYRPGLRCYPVGRYLIFYRVIDDELEEYRVLHGARRLEDLL